MRCTRWLWTGLVTIALLTGCTSSDEETADDEEAGPDAGLSAAESHSEESKRLAPLDATDLEPLFWGRGPASIVPPELIVEFPRSIRLDDRAPLGDGTEVRIEPDIAGEWRIGTDEQLVFRPKEAFEPGTSFEVVVEAIEVRRKHPTRDEVSSEIVRPETPWRHTFEVPTFEFVELLSPVGRADGTQVEVDLRFSAPPEQADLSKWAEWTVAGAGHQNVDYERSDREHVIRATLRNLDLDATDESNRVELQLAAGVPHDGHEAPAKSARKTIRFGESVEIRDLFLREGENGFFVHVVCDDGSVSKKTNFYNVHEYRHDYRDISRRCVPDVGSARRHIAFEPELDIRIAPAEAGFQILGDFDRGNYDLEIKPGLETIDGGVVGELTTESFEVGPRSPSASFVGSGRYIPPSAWENLAIRHRNLDAVRVAVRHVPRENLIFWLSGRDHDADRRTSNLIGTSTIGVGGEADEAKTSYVDLSNIVDQRNQGVHQIELSGLQRKENSNDHETVDSDTSRLVLTDLNLIAKRHEQAPDEAWSREVLVWSVDMHTGEPRGGVEVEAVRPSGYKLGECRTSADGNCHMELAPKKTDPTGPFALIAADEDDTTFLEYGDLKTEVPTGEIGGDPYLSDKPYRIGLYGDRDLYRPADTVHVAGVVRSSELTEVDPGIPVELELRNARGDVVRERVVKTNRAGAFEFRYELGEIAPTGRWRVTAETGSKELGTYSFFVEEFVPERMSVEVDPEREHYAAGDPATFSVRAEYLFGASAEGSEVKAECTLEPRDFTPPGRESYHFGSAPFERDDDSGTTQVGEFETTIGSDGTGSVECRNTGVSNRRSARLRANVSVLEAGSGRSTDETGEVWVHPERHHVGLRTQVDEVEENESFDVEGIVADARGERVDGVDEVEVEFISLDRDYSRYHRAGRGYDWRVEWRQIVTGQREVDVEDGTFEFSVNPTSLQDAFALRVRAGDASSTLQLDVDSLSYYWRYSDRDRTPSPMTPTTVPLEVDEPIEVGESVDVTFEAPFDGRALVAVETHRVLDYEWQSVEAGRNDWSFEIDEFVPNAYVTAFVIKNPHLESEDAFVPERAFGVTSVDVEATNHRGELEISAPTEVRPDGEFEVDVRADIGDGPAWATVAAVDEGILQLTDYESPDPLGSILGRRALGVETFDTVGWNVRMPSHGNPSGGGAARRGGGEGLGRAMPVEPVALWSGLVRLEGGRATIPFQVPRYTGELRIMGVAMGKKRIAAEDDSITVREPLGLKMTAPRFLSDDDEVEIPVFVTNQTGGAQSIRIEVASEPLPMPGARILTDRGDLVRFQGETDRRVELGAGDSETVVFRAKAVARSGAAKLRVDATAEGHESHTTATVPIQPDEPSERTVETVKIESRTTELDSHLTGWVPTSERTTFRVTDVPYAEALDAVRYLLDYPYGCLEQVTSSTRPLLYMSDLIESIDPDLREEYDDIDDMAEAGIDRVLAMQTPEGGFGYWPGRDHDAWSTAYATDMLVDAQKEGYGVPQARLDEAVGWMKQAARRSKYDHARPYMFYVLARAGEADKAAIRSEIERLERDDSDNSNRGEDLFVAKAALHLAGDRRYADDLKELSGLPTDATDGNEYGRTFYSHLRHFGWMLSIHLNLFGRTDQAESSVVRLAERMKNERSLNTQEAMWGVTALGKWIEEGSSKQKSELHSAELVVDGRSIEPSHKNEEGHPTWSVAHAADRSDVNLRADTGDGGNWYLTVSSEGVRENPSVEYGDHGLAVSRKYLDADGNAIDPYGIEVGDLFYVKLVVENQRLETVENVAVVDRLPAGLEVENPRLSGSPDILSTLVEDHSYDRNPRSGTEWWYDHMNIRDDRVRVFGDLPSHASRSVVYGVRATLGGSFAQPPIEAHAMYVPTTWSRQRGGTVRIATPWK